MARVLVFDLKAKMAHFRLPDTTVTHASYPFIPRTALHGLLAAILGLERLDTHMDGERSAAPVENFVGMSLLSRVRSSFQKLSMMGKGWAGSSRESFNKPVSIEIVATPHYRVFYLGSHLQKLEDMIRSKRAVYHTYLGSCYCPVFPVYVDTKEAEEMLWPLPGVITSKTVVPTCVVEKLIPQPGCEYARAGGLHYQYLGGRMFRGTLNLVYEVRGRSLTIEPKPTPPDTPVKFVKTAGGDILCLW